MKRLYSALWLLEFAPASDSSMKGEACCGCATGFAAAAFQSTHRTGIVRSRECPASACTLVRCVPRDCPETVTHRTRVHRETGPSHDKPFPRAVGTAVPWAGAQAAHWATAQAAPWATAQAAPWATGLVASAQQTQTPSHQVLRFMNGRTPNNPYVFQVWETVEVWMVVGCARTYVREIALG